jgi:hypothetical protein
MEHIEIEFLKRHLPYELDMFDAAAEYLQSPEFVAPADAIDRATSFKSNATIEVFWTHARNLIEFLTRPKSRSINEMAFAASARDFADGFHSKLDAETVLEKINAQICHLGFGRKAIHEQLGSIDINWVKPAIDSEIRRFEDSLNPACVKHWTKRHPAHFVNVLARASKTTSVARG